MADHDAELKHYKQLVAVNDSVFLIAKLRQAEELQVRYSTEEKENQISLLNRQAELEQSDLKRANLLRNMTMGAVLLSLAVAGLLYRQSKFRKKTNEIVTHKNELLQRLVTEKEWLLKEVHHRVKNNLHTVICLLESQAIYLENDALKAVENSQHRIYAMSLIHQKLYLSDDIKTINMKDYIVEFIRYLEEGFGSPDNIYIHLDIAPLKLGVSQAIPLGLIINEAITNSFKYAFPNNQIGKIWIQLLQDENEVRLLIADDGIGMVHAGDEAEPNSLGLELMKGLTRDIGGSILFTNEHGTKITVIFHINPFDILVNSSTITEPNFIAT